MKENSVKIVVNSNTLFGLLIGISFIFTSILFVSTGKSIAFNPYLYNIMLTLTVIGLFLGIRHYREERNSGVIKFLEAFTVGIKILLIASIIYAIYIFIIYSTSDQLLDAYRVNMISQFNNIYGETPFFQNSEEELRQGITPIVITFTEFFQRIFSGILFLLIISLLLRRKQYNSNIEQES